MAIYESRCEKCGTIQTYHRRIAERDETPICCDQVTVRGIFNPPGGFIDFPSDGPKKVYPKKQPRD
jgi:hypothetical protein